MERQSRTKRYCGMLDIVIGTADMFSGMQMMNKTSIAIGFLIMIIGMIMIEDNSGGQQE